MGYRISEYMIRTVFDRAFQISFNIIRMLKGCRDVVDTIRGWEGMANGKWAVVRVKIRQDRARFQTWNPLPWTSRRVMQSLRVIR